MSALAGRALRDARTRTISFAALFALYAYIQPAGYRQTYPTLADRLGFARSFGGNAALRLFYGYPFQLRTVGGYTAWRVGGTLAIAAAVFGVLAAVRALRAEEEAGRSELVLSCGAGRVRGYVAALAAIGASTLALWAALFAGFLAGALPAGSSAYLALATVSVVSVLAGAGALASQLAQTRRQAIELGSAAVGVSLLLRVIADTAGGAAWLRWLTPLGWAEMMRPFSGPRPGLLALALGSAAVQLALAGALASRRDVGTGLIAARDSSPPRLALLGSPAAQALRSERGTLLAWAGSSAIFAFVLGVVSESVSSRGVSAPLRRALGRLGYGAILTPAGYLSFVFVIFALALSLFACAQVNAARHEESSGRLATLLAQPAGRTAWFAGRLLLAAAAAGALALLAGLAAWIGAAAGGTGVSLGGMVGAGANCLPVALLFLAVAALAYALWPRAGAAVAYLLVCVAFLWQLVGSLVSAPGVLLELTPFAHLAAVPAQSFRWLDASVLLFLALLLGALAAVALRRRDLEEE